MYLNINKHDSSSIAVVDDSGDELSYGSLCLFCKEFAEVLPNRTLVFILSENSIASLLGYVACVNNHVVPLIRGILSSLLPSSYSFSIFSLMASISAGIALRSNLKPLPYNTLNRSPPLIGAGSSAMT